MKSILLKIAVFVFGPFSKLRKDMIKALLLAEPKANPQESLPWLLEINDFIDDTIDKHCIAMGDGIHVKHEIMSGIHSFFYERIKPEARVLDVGCGTGAVANAIASKAGAHVTGIDTNSASISFSKRHFSNPNLKFIRGDATTNLPDESFDVIVLSSLLEHIDERPEFIKSLTARYKPEKFLIRVPLFDRHYYAPLKKKLGLFAYTDPDHRLEYSPETFTKEMSTSGLEIIHSEIRWGDLWTECVPTQL